MLQKSTYEFLKELRINNNREWFADNKGRYEQARADFEALIAEIIPGIAQFDESIGNPEAKKCLFRIYRDTRFSPDKTPYKTNFGAIVRSDTRAGNLSGYYLHIAPDEMFISSGLYMLRPDLIKYVRKFIYDDFNNFRSIIEDKTFKKEFNDLQFDEGETLTRIPAGFDKNHPAAEYMKLKHFYIMKTFDEKRLFGKDFVSQTVQTFKAMCPFNTYMNSIVSEFNESRSSKYEF
jgi:uncharacterized protein (TIGR02453 family)